jgi:L-ornithine Nalpha-acyltransferase
MSQVQELQPSIEHITIRLAKNEADIEAAQRLRYQVFYEECAAIPDKRTAVERLDRDDYDPFADHLIVVDHSDGKERIVGTYRLLLRDAAERCGKFYSSNEYDLSPILSSGASVLELGRSCVLPEYRSRPVLQLLWQGIADYVTENKIDLMFGCASLHSTDIKSIAAPLSYLHHYHLAPELFRARALKGRYINMNIIPKEDLNVKEVFGLLPPLIKGYLRVGATIGDGAVIDHQFNTTDVCIIVQTHQVTKRYRTHYERKIGKAMPHQERAGDNVASFPRKTD